MVPCPDTPDSQLGIRFPRTPTANRLQHSFAGTATSVFPELVRLSASQYSGSPFLFWKATARSPCRRESNGIGSSTGILGARVKLTGRIPPQSGSGRCSIVTPLRLLPTPSSVPLSSTLSANSRLPWGQGCDQCVRPKLRLTSPGPPTEPRYGFVPHSEKKRCGRSNDPFSL